MSQDVVVQRRDVGSRRQVCIPDTRTRQGTARKPSIARSARTDVQYTPNLRCGIVVTWIYASSLGGTVKQGRIRSHLPFHTYKWPLTPPLTNRAGAMADPHSIVCRLPTFPNRPILGLNNLTREVTSVLRYSIYEKQRKTSLE